MDIFIWTTVIMLMLVGVVGSVVPLLPGTTLILLAALLQKWLLPETISWSAVVWISVFWFISMVADIGCTILGAKWFGGTKWGMAGATGGAMAGMFFSLPALLLATIFGAFLAEKWLGKQTTETAIKAGVGGALGFLLSTVAKLVCAFVMIGCYLISVLSASPIR